MGERIRGKVKEDGSAESRGTYDVPRTTYNSLKTAPAVVSGLLVFALVAGQEMVVSNKKAIAYDCSTGKVKFEFKANGDQCQAETSKLITPVTTKTCSQTNPYGCIEPGPGSCLLSAVLALPSCDTTGTHTYTCSCVPDLTNPFPPK